MRSRYTVCLRVVVTESDLEAGRGRGINAAVVSSETSRGAVPCAQPKSHLSAPAPVVEQIDEIVASRMDQPDRSAVIRELIVEALTAREKKRGRG